MSTWPDVVLAAVGLLALVAILAWVYFMVNPWRRR